METNKAPNLTQYHDFSKKVSLAFDEFILNEFKKRPDFPILNDLYKKFLQNKFGTNHQRVTWVFIAAKYFCIDTEKNFDLLLRLAAVPELLIWSEYCFNWVTDGKNNDSGTKYETNMQLIACQYLLTEVTYFLPERMLKRYLELYRWGIYGCLVVERDLRITNWEKMHDWPTFWKMYSDNHCIPDVGALYGYCFELIHDYFEIGLPKEKLDRICKIGYEFGRSLQINGDLSDLMNPESPVSTTEKRPEKDYFIDIRTDRLTYPTWHLLNAAEKDSSVLFDEIMASAASRKYPDELFYVRVYDALKHHRTIPTIIKYIHSEKRRLLKEIKLIGITNDGSKLWQSAMVILVTNKFQRYLKLMERSH